jgi:hypothetical protein
MYTTSTTYNNILAGDHWFECSVVIGESGRLVTEKGEYITFGGDNILVSQGSADSGFTESWIQSLKIEQSAFSEDAPSVGSALSAELTLTMVRPAGAIPRMALVRPYIRAVNDTQASEWIPQGIFYIDTREYTQNDDNLSILTIHAYDAMLMTEQDYPSTTHEWTDFKDIDVVREIADTLGIGVDARTVERMTAGYVISAPAGYSMREVLGYIAAMYGGNFVMNYDGELLLIALNSMPAETDYLVDGFGYAITFGGDRILV